MIYIFYDAYRLFDSDNWECQQQSLNRFSYFKLSIKISAYYSYNEYKNDVKLIAHLSKPVTAQIT